MKLLVADQLPTSAIDRMKKAGIDVVVNVELTPEKLRSEIPAYDAIAIRSATRITSEIIDAGTKLKLIVRAGSGLDNVDQAAADERDVVICNTPSATAISVAEYTIALMLSLVRHIPAAHRKLTEGNWDKKSFQGRELFGKTLGIIGLGRIGREVAKRAQAFGMQIIVNDPLIDPSISDNLQIPLISLLDLLPQSDIITLHIPFIPETANLISKQHIALMKPGTYVINCSRGGVIDETALAEALHNGHLGGAALDVFSKEPLTASPLMNTPHTVLTPHIAGSTFEGQERAGAELADIVIGFAAARSI